MTAQARYIPPDFGLIEWTDEDESATRWLASWQGLLGAPAEQVCLGWMREAATAVVATQSLDRDPTEADRRRTALLLLLAGDQMSLQVKPAGASAIQETISDLAGTDNRWSIASVLVDGTTVPAAIISYADEVLVGYFPHTERLIAFACTGMGQSQLHFRQLTQRPSGYLLDPRHAANSAELLEQQPTGWA